MLGATRFLIIGVQKRAGPLRGNEVWLFDATAAPGFVAQGRKKYAALLRHHARQLAAPGLAHAAGLAAHCRRTPT